MADEINNLIMVTLSILASLFYCYFVSSNIPIPTFRLISLLPVIFVFLILPFFFSCVFPTAITSVFISWSTNFKLILFAFLSGPLSSAHSLIHFISVAVFPIKFKSYPSHSPPPQSPSLSTLAWSSKVLLLAILIKITDYRDRLNHNAVLILYCSLAYILVDIIFGIGNAVVCAILNSELDPPSDQPYFSTSLQDFWGRRWNLMITNLLRYTVYEPTRLCLDTKLGKWSPPVAILATFLVSGLMHELLFYHITRASPTWEVTCFFLVHGVCVVVEITLLKSKFRGKRELYWVVSAALTVGFVVVTATWLFFPPIIRTNTAGKAIEEVKAVLNLLNFPA